MSDILNWIWLSTKLPPASPSTDALLKHFDYSADAVYRADAEELSKAEGPASNYIEKLSDKDMSEAEDIYNWCTENNVGLLPYDHKLYPQRLRDIEKAPILLYFRGKLINFDDNVCIALVGTRRMTDYGKREGYRIARDLVLGGAVVVSGMARGIDTICHRGALDAGGYTVAVLGCGIDRVYPPENDYIMREIAEHGLVITEFRPFTPPLGGNFPTRNRIISGLSLGTLVVEADDKSGAMITARCAEKQGRDIFSIPGNVGELNSLGTNSLLKRGAKIVTGALDMLEEYQYIYPHRIRIENLPAFMPKFTSSRRNTHPHSSNVSHKSENIAVQGTEKSENKPSYSKKDKKAEKAFKKEEETTSKLENNAKNETAKDTSALNDEELLIYSLFPSDSSISADELSRSGVSVGKVMKNLTMLEIKGFIKALPGGLFAKT